MTYRYILQRKQKENKERKDGGRKTKRCLQRKQTAATVENRPRLLSWVGVLEETKLHL